MIKEDQICHIIEIDIINFQIMQIRDNKQVWDYFMSGFLDLRIKL